MNLSSIFALDLTKLYSKSINSGFYRFVLSYFIRRFIPFNGPHRFRVVKAEEDRVVVGLPYRRRNLNHLKGLHAGALATLCELTSGLLLIAKLDPRKYRLILQKLEVEYHYQGRMEAYGTFEIDQHWLLKEVIGPLELSDAVICPCTVEIKDGEDNLLARGTAHWQLKNWKAVKSKRQ